MAIYTVDTKADIVDAGDGVLSLREALALADATPDRRHDPVRARGAGPDHRAGRQPAHRQLRRHHRRRQGVTIDAHGKSRVLLVQGDGTDVTLAHLTVTGGRTKGVTILAAASMPTTITTLTLDHATVSGNRTAGDDAGGGGIFGYRRDSDRQHGQRQPHDG